MKVSKSWLEELVEIENIKEVERLLPLRTIGTKEVTDSFIELDMKGYNRADLLSMRGVAYEVASILGSKVKFEEAEEKEFLWQKENLPKLNVQVEDIELCPLYCLVKIEGLKAGESESTCRQKLENCGMRPVNNIADITNLVMLEYGQPMHAFDAAKVKDESIIVRRAKIDEVIETLDGKLRKLKESDLLIADIEKPLGIAGVMGGVNCEVSETTTTVLLEAAIFDPINLRKTATSLNLTSEAGKRFYHGLTKKGLLQSLNAALGMYRSLGGRVTGFTITGSYEDRGVEITLDKKRLDSLIGVKIDSGNVENYLKRLKFEFSGDRSVYKVKPPYFRLDINIEEDLIEEIARMYGYENIEPMELEGEIPAKIDQSLFEFIEKLKKVLAGAGLTEVQTYSFFSTQVLESLSLDKNSLVRIANPISSETEYLRNELWPNLAEVVAKNVRNGFSDAAVFEVGKVYYSSREQTPKEVHAVAIALVNNTNNPLGELYQIFKAIQETMELGLKVGGNIRDYEKTFFHPNRCLLLKKGGATAGVTGEVHPRIINKLGIEKRVAVLEFALEKTL